MPAQCIAQPNLHCKLFAIAAEQCNPRLELLPSELQTEAVQHNMQVLQTLQTRRNDSIRQLQTAVAGEVPVYLQRRLGYVNINFLDTCLHEVLDKTLDLKPKVCTHADLSLFGKFHVQQIQANLSTEIRPSEAAQSACVAALDSMSQVHKIMQDVHSVSLQNVSVLYRQQLKTGILRTCAAAGSTYMPVISAVHVRYDSKPVQKQLTVRDMFAQQLDADHQHRIISARLHQHLQGLLSSAKTDIETQKAKATAVQIFHPSLQPWAAAAMTNSDADDLTWKFLHNTTESCGTGYQEAKTCELTLELMQM